MAVPEFTHVDVTQLLKIQEEIRQLLRQYADRTPAIVPAVALIRVAKVLLDVYPEHDRQVTLTDIIIPFLRGEAQQPSKRKKSNLILPPGFSLN